ncbi:MAG: TonB-dependent receptor [Gemmatimonadetes bacterium]|nr:TonB-dependent receptor [Gemmatimonadota bacterium]
MHRTSYSWGGTSAFIPRNLGNPDLGPERTAELEAGFENSLLNGRLSLDATFYRRITRDALFAVSQAPSEGLWSSQLENVGRLKSNGVEVGVNAALVQRFRASAGRRPHLLDELKRGPEPRRRLLLLHRELRLDHRGEAGAEHPGILRRQSQRVRRADSQGGLRLRSQHAHRDHLGVIKLHAAGRLQPLGTWRVPGRALRLQPARRRGHRARHPVAVVLQRVSGDRRGRLEPGAGVGSRALHIVEGYPRLRDLPARLLPPARRHPASLLRAELRGRHQCPGLALGTEPLLVEEGQDSLLDPETSGGFTTGNTGMSQQVRSVGGSIPIPRTFLMSVRLTF